MTKSRIQKALLILSLFSCLSISAQQLQLGADHVYIDHELKMVVSNQDIELLNYLYPFGITSIELNGHSYDFLSTVNQLETGTSYAIEADESVYQLYFTSLPVVSIEMDGMPVNFERRLATASITSSDGVTIHADLGINIRGGYSQFLPKKSYRMEFVSLANDTMVNRNVKLLDLRNDDDWLLLPMFNEPLRLRNAVGHRLWEDMHTLKYQQEEPTALPGTRARYVELILNDKYRGVYLLTERVDRKQLQLKKYSQGHDMEGELYKGSDYAAGTVTFDFLAFYNNNSRTWDGFEKKYPLREMTTDWSGLYELISVILQTSDSVFSQQINSYFDLDNAVDYFLFLNLLYAQDNTGKNLFVARYSAETPFFFVPWDLDGILGIDWKSDFLGIRTDLLSNGLFDRLVVN